MKLTNIVKHYGDVRALGPLDLEIEEGKITAVLGESGAGKTTLLGVLSGLIPCEGTVEGRGRFSYLFQDAKLLPHLTVTGNLKLVLPRSEWGKIGEMLERVGLEGKENRLPSELSGGERRRAAIARAFLYPHDVLLMDEPFSSLDLKLKKNLIELVASLRREGETVVFVTHDVREAVLLSHRALVLKGGRLAGDLEIGGEPPRGFFDRIPEEEELVRALMREEQTDR